MRQIPKQNKVDSTKVKPTNLKTDDILNQKVLFSFEAIEKNEYFNLDGTCANWAADLFDTMQKVSKINMKDIYAGLYTGHNSPFRIHQHDKAKAPCKVPESVSLEDMWQIRISLSKGGIHGIFYENVFYVIWFDPQHNMYPSANHGGLKKIKAPLTCCKDRDIEIERLQNELLETKKEVTFWEQCYQEKIN